MSHPPRAFRLLTLSCFVIVLTVAFMTSRRAAISIAATESPTIAATSEGTQAAAIVPTPGKWSSGEVKWKDTTYTLNFTVSDDRKSVTIEILIPNANLCGIIGMADFKVSFSPIDLKQNTFSLQIPIPDEQTEIEGMFTSPTQAKGTYTFSRKDCKVQFEWTATPVTAQATPAPTAVPTMAVTAQGTAAARIVPQPGHWEGSNPSVSFEVSADGKISNFHMVAPFKFDFPNTPKLSTCNYDIEEIEVTADSSFTTSYRSNLTEFGFKAAQVSFMMDNLGIKPDSNGKYEVRHVQGQFTTTTTVTGKVQVLLCENKYIAFNPESSWNAELKTPLQATPAPTAGATMAATTTK